MPDQSRGGPAACMALALLLSAAAGSTAAVAQSTNSFDVVVSPAARATLTRAENLLAAGNGQQAWALLQPLEIELAGNPYYDYLLGVAALDTGRYSEAIFSLRRAIAVQPNFSGARMELGRAYYEAGNAGLARPLFVALLDENPPAGVRDVLHRYINAIDARPPVPQPRLDGYLSLFAGSDSNANGSTSNQQFLGFTLNPENLETDSPFFEAAAGFTWLVPQSTQLAWLVNGRASHRDNSDAPFINATVLSAYGGLTWQRGAFFGRAGIDPYRVARDGDENETYVGADLLLGRRLTPDWDLTLGLRGGAHRFDSAIEVLDVDRVLYNVGVTWRFRERSSLTLQGIGGSDNEKLGGSPYGNSKVGGRLSLSTALGGKAFLHSSYGSLTSDYDGLFFGGPREDEQRTATLRIEFRDVWTDGLTLMPSFRYVDNESDIPLYEYDRTEIGLLIRWAP